MSLFTSILTAGSNSHQESSENANAGMTDFVTQGVIGAITNTANVAPMTGAYAVNAQGSPNMTVAVSSGVAYVTATPASQNSQTLRVRDTASSNVTIAANASGSTKFDWIYIQVDATKAANPASDASDVATLVVSRSSSGTTDNGTPPTYGLNIAVVTVANAAASITNGNIADKRAYAQIGSRVTSYNPYKFAVYRSAALSLTNASWNLVACDTKLFDTSTNVDVATNKGRFTAPIAGFYQFNLHVGIVNMTDGQLFACSLYKNGVQYVTGNIMQNRNTVTPIAVSAALIQLAQNDYIEPYVFNGGTSLSLSVASPPQNNMFSGFLVSAT